MNFDEQEEPEMPLIRDYLSSEEILCQLAEEAAELAQAALKLRRVFSDTNPTPVTLPQAYMALREELADVQECAEAYYLVAPYDDGQNFAAIEQIKRSKHARWLKRLEEASRKRIEATNG